MDYFEYFQTFMALRNARYGGKGQKMVGSAHGRAKDSNSVLWRDTRNALRLEGGTGIVPLKAKSA
jgi:hypothetical protein